MPDEYKILKDIKDNCQALHKYYNYKYRNILTDYRITFPFYLFFFVTIWP